MHAKRYKKFENMRALQCYSAAPPVLDHCYPLTSSKLYGTGFVVSRLSHQNNKLCLLTSLF